MLKPELTIYDYTRILKKRKWIVLIALAFVLLFTLIFTVLQENVYRTRSTIMLGKANGLASVVQDAYALEANIHAEAKVIRSTPVLEKVARLLYEREAGTNAVVLDQREIDRRVGALSGAIMTSVDTNTKTIDCFVNGTDPEVTKVTADAVSTSYVEYCSERKYQDAVQANTFLMDQLGIYRKKLDEDEEKLQRFKEAEGIVDIGLELQSQLTTAHGVATMLAESTAQRKTLEERRRLLRQSNGESSSAVSGGSDATQSKSYMDLKAKITEIEMERIRALEIYTPAHPEVKRIEAQIRAAQEQIRSYLSQYKDTATAALDAQIGAEEARCTALEEMLRQVNETISRLPRKQAQLARLEQRAEFTRNLVSVFNKKLEDSNIFSAERSTDLPTVLERAALPTTAVSPRPLVNLLIGLVTGLMIGVFLAFFVESIDVSISTVEEVENYVSLPVLGIIPFIGEDAFGEKPKARSDTAIGERCVIYHRPRSIGAEAFRIVRTNLHFAMMGERKTILVASSLPGEGKTFVAVNLAITFAQLGSKVLLCDFNLRDPEMHTYFGLSKNPGVTDILIGDMDWREAVKPTPINNLHMLCSGPIPPNPSELLISSQCDALIEKLKAEYDLIVFDSSPLIPVTDGSILSTKLDFTMLVHNAIQTSMMVLLRAKSLLSGVKGNVGGVLLNQLKSTIFMDTDIPMNYYYASKEKNRRRSSREGA